MLVHFEADVENGAIKVPQDIMAQLSDCKHLRVTVEAEKQNELKRQPDIFDELMSQAPWFKGPYLTRDEIYDRRD